MVSVIVPVFNGVEFLGRAVESALSQTYEDVEIIVVNDGSTDGSADLAEGLKRADKRVRVVHQENRGLSAARNSGIRNAEGDFINFLDADDWLLPEKLHHQVRAFSTADRVGLVYSDYVKSDGGTEYPMQRGKPPIPFVDLFVYRNWFAPHVPLLRRRLVETVGDFDTKMRATEDRDYWYRCAQHTEFAYAPGVMAVYRIHGQQMTRDIDRMIKGQQHFAAKHFGNDRRRLRSSMSYHHLFMAKQYKGSGDCLRCAQQLVGYMTSVNSIREARFVWTIASR